MTTRSLICTVVGHVDHGKSSILDFIRKTSIINTEPGKITQSIGASIIPLNTIKKVCGDLVKSIKMTIPGLLFIDTPGHAAFSTLRKRGGNLADIAILVVDINEGFKPQTIESIEILRQYKTPFIVAANKVDLIHGWKKEKGSFLQVLSKQDQKVQKDFETKMYNLVGQFYEKFQLDAERFDRVDDYTKKIALIPTSATTGLGIPELLAVLTGLSQKYMDKCLDCDVKGSAKGTVLEVKEEKGIGISLDVIIYNGSLKVNDTIVIGGVEQPIITKVRALFEPAPLSEMRDKKSKFKSVKEIFAATGVKIAAPDIDNVIAGMPLKSTNKDNLEETKKELQKEVEEVIIETDQKGIVIKADSLGSLEALSKLLKEKDIAIKSANIGNISKKDVAEAESIHEEDPLQSVILGFNITDESNTKSKHVKIITDNIIYSLIDKFEKWQRDELLKQQSKELDLLVRPAKVQLMQGYVFRQSNPAIVGADILSGKIKTGMPLMNKEGKTLTTIKSIQHEKENLSEAEKGKQVALSLENVTVGRQIKEGDFLYSAIPEEHFKKIKTLKKFLSKEEITLLKEIAEIMRSQNPVWGV